PMGARLLSQWIKQPLLLPKPIEERYEAIDELIKNSDCHNRLRSQFKYIRDLERLLSRITCGVCSARDLTAIKESLKIIPELKDNISTLRSPLIMKQQQELFELRDLVSLIERSLVDQPPFSIKGGGLIKKGYHLELDEIRDIALNGKQWIANFQN
ncbi:MAG: DNA mismatch repair protein MutS, partial [Proteobacteria bacterium]|nr:DNA mismatch repair protein MutS [Pseudomonadota bacterium]